MLRSCARTALRLSATRPALHSALRASIPRPSSSSISTRFTMARSASTTSGPSSSFDPQTVAAQEALDEGTEALQTGDFATAEQAYQKSVGIKETSIGYYNLGVVQYQLQRLPAAIASFEKSLSLTPPGVKVTLPDPTAPLPELTPAQIILADTHTNLGAAYILSQPPRPEKALEHLQKALMVNPDDGEVCFNLAAVLEATGELDEALVAFERAHKLGIQRAEVNIRNVQAKLVGKKREEAEKAAKNGAGAGSLESQDVSPSS
ncbi:hypothetical protein JCM8097_004965 [Rhodosporidiobolus ruineniae]